MDYANSLYAQQAQQNVGTVPQAPRLVDIAAMAAKQREELFNAAIRLTELADRLVGEVPIETDQAKGPSALPNGLLDRLSMEQADTAVVIASIMRTLDRLERIG